MFLELSRSDDERARVDGDLHREGAAVGQSVDAREPRTRTQRLIAHKHMFRASGLTKDQRNSTKITTPAGGVNAKEKEKKKK